MHVALQEGFSNDTVSLWLNGSEVARRTNVRTRNQIGFAEAVELDDLGARKVELEVRIETRSLVAATTIHVAGTTYVGVNVTPDGRVLIEQSREPFRYL